MKATTRDPKHKANAEGATSDWKTVRAPQAVQAVFAVACAVVCLVPLVGMAWAPTTETTENRELASVPQLIQDGSFNWDYLSDWGTYFEDHFAYRNELVSLNAELQAGLLQTSPTDSVVVGTDGWLYYGGTLSDYCGLNRLSDRAISNIANNLALMQGYCEAQGATFSVAIAPNKNSLYPQNMPYYYLQEQGSDLLELQAALGEYGVNYSDLYGAFSSRDQILYYLRDTHWNTKGALLAYSAIQASLGRSDGEASALVPNVVDNYIGDLNRMLYPTTATPETDYSYSELDWSYVEGDSTEDAWVQTMGSGEGSVLVFRDSFTNNMLQFFADGYKTAYFSKYVPYDLTQVGELGVDAVVIERAERHMADLAEDPAIMPAPTVSLNGVSMLGATDASDVEVGQDGTFAVVSGNIAEDDCDVDSGIFIGIESGGDVTWYVPFRVTSSLGDYGYKAYLPQQVVDEAQKIYVACENNGMLTAVRSQALS